MHHNRYTQETFLKKASKKHGNVYDYSNSVYVGSNIKVKITCLTHGIFEQTPAAHLMGQGCKNCHFKKLSLLKKNTQEKFIENARKLYGDKYGYDKVIYEYNDSMVLIECKIHGYFNQTPSGHLKGDGCEKCSPLGRKSNTDEFIKKSILIHGDKYDYSKVNYKDKNTPVEIICRNHGVFFQSPCVHHRGCGCRKCKERIGEKAVRNYLEKNNIKYIKEFKVKGVGRFDFKVEKDRKTYFVEFQGKQHYKPVPFSGNKYTGNKEFKKCVVNDEYKLRWCKLNNFNLILIPFWHIKDIDSILDKFFNNEIYNFKELPNDIKNFELKKAKILSRNKYYNKIFYKRKPLELQG